jgi:hypothetical protein
MLEIEKDSPNNLELAQEVYNACAIKKRKNMKVHEWMYGLEIIISTWDQIHNYQ